MKIIQLILIAVGIGTMAFLGYVGLQKVDRYLDMKALHECAQDYKMEITNTETNEVKIRPLEQQVKECAWQKGVRNWEGVWSDLP